MPFTISGTLPVTAGRRASSATTSVSGTVSANIVSSTCRSRKAPAAYARLRALSALLAALIQIVAHELEHFGQLSAAISAEVKRGELRRFYVKQIESTNNRGVRGWPFSMRLARRLAISVPCSYRCVANECLRTCGDTRFSIPMASAVSRTTL